MTDRHTVFCFPFAGGNRYSYRMYNTLAPAAIKFKTIEYSGRGSRLREGLQFDVHSIAEDIFQQISDLYQGYEFAIYGHSLGGLLGYLVTRLLWENKMTLPSHLFITGTTGPSSLSRGEKKRHLLSKEDFIQELKDLKGMPEEILQNEDLLEYYEPILRADFQASENYVHRERFALQLPITVITGTEEDMEPSDILLWQNETTETIEFKQLPGGHFFINDHPQKIVDIISDKLLHTKKVYQL